MCTTPKLLYIRGASGNVFKTYTSCGHCQECRNTLRAQTVLRINAELEAPTTKCAYFYTLQYNNENLHYYSNNPSAKYQAVRKQMQEPDETKRNWDKFILSKLDASKLLKKLQTKIKKYDKKYLVRYYLIAEYGSVTNRPHMHILIFYPITLKRGDALKFVEDCWQFGHVEIRNVGAWNINYTAHHQVKEEDGTEWQQKHCPTFHLTSRYKGGIGYNILERKDLIRNFELGKKIVKHNKYTVLIPRFAVRRLHPEPNTDAELQQLSDNSIFNYALMMKSTCKQKYNEQTEYNDYLKLLSENQKIVNREKQEYKAHRKRVKLSRLQQRKYVINKNKELYEHF